MTLILFTAFAWSAFTILSFTRYITAREPQHGTSRDLLYRYGSFIADFWFNDGEPLDKVEIPERPETSSSS